MLIFVSGGSRSGKSEWAERAVIALSGDGPRIYLATALVSDEDMRRRVERHRKARRGRGFATIERPYNLSGVLHSIPDGASVLLECLPNWLANEMFMNGPRRGADKVREEISRTSLSLALCCKNLVIVSDDIFSDGVTYDEATEEYIKLLGRLHIMLAAKADAAVECVAGTPYVVKGSLRTART